MLITDIEKHGTPMLEVTGGSYAYGLEHEGSDVDHLGIFIAPTKSLASIGSGNPYEPPAKVLTHQDLTNGTDDTWYELTYACTLLAKGQFNVMPLLFSDIKTLVTDEAIQLFTIRDAFISKLMVRPVLGSAKKVFTDYIQEDYIKNSPGATLAILWRLNVLADKFIQRDFGLRFTDSNQETYHTIRLHHDNLDPDLVYRINDNLVLIEKELENTNRLPEAPDIDTIQNFIYGIRRRF